MSYQATVKDMLYVMRELPGLDHVRELPGFDEASHDTVQAVLDGG